MILEKEYAYSYWLTCKMESEIFIGFVKELEMFNETHGIQITDGVDEEDQSICFKFSQYKPKGEGQIKHAKLMNEKHGRKFLQLLSKKVAGKFYFNVNLNLIKRL